MTDNKLDEQQQHTDLTEPEPSYYDSIEYMLKVIKALQYFNTIYKESNPNVTSTDLINYITIFNYCVHNLAAAADMTDQELSEAAAEK